MAKYTSQNLSEKKGLKAKTKWGISIFVISFVLFVLTAFNIIVPVHKFMLGAFGLCVYPIMLLLMAVGILLMLKKRYYVEKFYLFVILFLFFLIVSFFQLVLTNTNVSFATYLSNCYESGTTVGGVLMGIITFILYSGLGVAGTIIMQAIALVLCVAFIIDHFLKIKENQGILERTITYPKEEKENKIIKSKKNFNELDEKPAKKQKEKVNITLDGFNEKQKEKKDIKQSLLEKTSYKSEDDMAIKIFGEEFINNIKSTSKPSVPEKKEYNLSELYTKKQDEEVFSFNEKQDDKPTRFIHSNEEDILSAKLDLNNNLFFEEEKPSVEPTHDIDLSLKKDKIEKNEIDDNFEINQKFNENPFVEKTEANNTDDEIDEIISEDEEFEQMIEQDDETQEIDEEIEEEEQETQNEEKEEEPKKKVYAPYVRPPIDLLTTKSSIMQVNQQEYQSKALILEQTLESFKISAKVVGITRGPAVTRYELQMPVGIPVKRITQHVDDISMMMESRAGVRIEAPIPGRNLVGIEVPNDTIATIGLKDIIESSEFSQTKGKLTFALGKDIAGVCKVCDLDAMPHLLVAGSTGSGKSVCLNVLLISLLYKLGPDELKLLLIDPKRVEFVSYNYLPHMIVPRAINDSQQAINSLDWANNEMMRRYTMFTEYGVRNFKEFNNLDVVLNGEQEKLPYIVIVIDELADLMLMAGRDLEEKIQRLTQLARAAGIHLIIATQRPSVDVITGVIKSNLPSRIAFAVTDFASSKTILDKGGADKLLGKGDMLYAPQNLPEPIRIQCPYVDGKEVNQIVDFIKRNNKAEFDDSISQFITKNDKSNDGKTPIEQNAGNANGNGWDPLLPQALMDFIQTGSCSASMIQRRHSIGFVRAGRIVDQMEQAGFISAPDPAKRTRSVLITLEKYNEIFGEDEE